MRKCRHDTEYRALFCARFLELEAQSGKIPRVDRFMEQVVVRIHRTMNTICHAPSPRVVSVWLLATTVGNNAPTPTK